MSSNSSSNGGGGGSPISGGSSGGRITGTGQSEGERGAILERLKKQLGEKMGTPTDAAFGSGAFDRLTGRAIGDFNEALPPAALTPPSPTSEDPTVKAKTQAQLAEAQDVETKARSRAATVYAGKNPSLSSAPKVSRRTLMGA